MTNIIRSVRAELNLGHVAIDCYMLPDGEKRIGLAGASLAIGHGKEYLSRLFTKQPSTLNELKKLGFNGSIIEVEVVIDRGATRAKTISIEDFNVLILYFAKEKTKKKENKSSSEKDIQQLLAIRCNGEIEIPTEAGRIDILSSTEIIEVKEVTAWKSALGQILIYGEYYPSHKKRIHLFGQAHSSYLKIIEKHCTKFDVNVTFEEV